MSVLLLTVTNNFGYPPQETSTKEQKEMSVKEWILRYAEQQSDEEKNESVKETDEEKFDPVRQNV